MLLGSLLDWKDAESSVPASPPLPSSPNPPLSSNPQAQSPSIQSQATTRIPYDPDSLARLFATYNSGFLEAVFPNAGKSAGSSSAHSSMYIAETPKRSDTISTFFSSNEKKKKRISILDKFKDRGLPS
jgi:hypothetical protein